ncbi:hypothetical protein FACS1894202_13680 [Clostridia bacterium]|nr:hypothetical protein FACS1894202_13680 [Clostridia bacterium]
MKFQNKKESGGEPVSEAVKTVIQTDYAKELKPGEMGSVTINYKFDGLLLDDEPFGKIDDGEVMFELPGAGIITATGEPALVREGIFIAMPPGAVYEAAQVVVQSEERLEKTYSIIPFPITGLEDDDIIFLRNNAIYNSSDAYPAQICEYLGTQDIFGVQCAHISICPMRYIPNTGVLTVLSDVEITIWYKQGADGGGSESGGGLYRPDFAYMLHGYTPPEESGETSERNDKRNILVVTRHGELAYAFSQYAAAKTASGRYTIEYLVLPPERNAVQIKKEIDLQFSRNKFDFLIIVGSERVIPAYHYGTPGALFASDSYYSFKNSFFGLIETPRFAVSRFPADTAEELRDMCEVASEYPNRYAAGIRKTAVMAAWKRDEQEYSNETRAFDEDATRAETLAQNGGFTTSRYNGVDNTVAELVTAINAGAGFVSYRGHGSQTGWGSSIGITNANLNGTAVNPQIAVGDNTPHVLSIACSTAAIHRQGTPCFGVTWINRRQAVSFLGASRTSNRHINSNFNRFLWEDIARQNAPSTIGDIFLRATVKLCQQYPHDSRRITNVKAYLLLGDGTADYLEQPAPPPAP